MFLPTSVFELDNLGWQNPDVLLISGDAYVDHPSFATAILGKYLLKSGFKVAVLPQPDIKNYIPAERLKPNLFIGIVPGSVDSMIANYTANRRLRSEDDFSEDGKAGKRPDRAVIQYTVFAKRHFKNIPVIIGGIESSLRRFVHYDYWSEKVRNGILFDSKADFLVFGQGESTLLRIAKAYQEKNIQSIKTFENVAYLLNDKDYLELTENFSSKDFITLPSFEEIKGSKEKFLLSHKLIHENLNPFLKTGFIQSFGTRYQIFNPPLLPLADGGLDEFYDLDFERKPHPGYKGKIPSFEMIKNSVTIHRGCFGGCSFCAIALSQGKFIQSRSKDSILKEVKKIRSKSLSDLGGPSANMYMMTGKNKEICKKCKRISCLYPDICPNLNTSHKNVLNLYKIIGKEKKFYVNSGIRHDLALCDPTYIKEIAQNHTSGILKIAPEHSENEVLNLMFKPTIQKFEEFVRFFKKFTPKERKQFIVPYLISSFPGCTLDIMKKMMLYLKRNRIRIEQVQDFLPTPLSVASVYYYCGKDLSGNAIHIPNKGKERRIHRALMQFYKKENIRFLKNNKII